jgi:hypothetical protein
MSPLLTLDIQTWLDDLAGPGAARMAELGAGSFVLLMVVSAVSGLLVATLYRIFFRARATGSEIHRAFPLISLSVTAIFITIQFSLPLSLGLLGALSIVRFRTPIKEPEEIGFLMLVVATGLCCATFNLLFLGIVLGVAMLTLTVLHLRSGLLGQAPKHGMLVVTLPQADYQSRGGDLLRVLEERLPGGRLDAVNEDVDEATVSYGFRSLEATQVPALQAVLRDLSPALRTDLYYTRST